MALVNKKRFASAALDSPEENFFFCLPRTLLAEIFFLLDPLDAARLLQALPSLLSFWRRLKQEHEKKWSLDVWVGSDGEHMFKVKVRVPFTARFSDFVNYGACGYVPMYRGFLSDGTRGDFDRGGMYYIHSSSSIYPFICSDRNGNHELELVWSFGMLPHYQAKWFCKTLSGEMVSVPYQ